MILIEFGLYRWVESDFATRLRDCERRLFRVGFLEAGQLRAACTSRNARMWVMFKVASWNLNSVRSRLTHVTTWLKAREPDVLLLQELKGTEFPSEAFNSLGYESVAVTQKAYNGDGGHQQDAQNDFSAHWVSPKLMSCPTGFCHTLQRIGNQQQVSDF